jgi:hypothetical protein
LVADRKGRRVVFQGGSVRQSEEDRCAGVEEKLTISPWLRSPRSAMIRAGPSAVPLPSAISRAIVARWWTAH